jgi:hypothetical protein
VLDPATLAVRRSFEVGKVAADLAADSNGRLFLSESGQWTMIYVLDGREGKILTFWPAKMHGRIYMQLIPDGSRLYYGTSSLVSNNLRGLLIREPIVPPPAQPPAQIGQTSSDSSGPVRGEFFLTPDSNFIVTRWGKVLRLIPPRPEKSRGTLRAFPANP